MIAIIAGILAVLGPIVGWYFGKEHQKKKAHKQMMVQRAEFLDALAKGDEEAIRRLFGAN